MDNPGTESSDSGDLNIDGAAAAFASIIDPEPPKEDTPADPPKTEDPPADAPEAEDPPQGDPPAEEDPLVTIKIDGQDVEVKLSELKNGYQRQADYTRKTMETAEQRKAADAEYQKAVAERQTYAQNLQRLQIQAESALQEQNQIDWQKLIDTDPQEALRQQHLFNQRQAQLQQIYGEQQRIAAINQAEAAKRQKEYIESQHQALLDKLPDWRDPAKAKAEASAIREYLASQGWEPEALNNVTDSRAVLMARKAMLYDQMVSKAQVAVKKVQTAPQKVIQPGTGNAPSLDKRGAAFQRLSKSGRVEDAASVFASFL